MNETKEVKLIINWASIEWLCMAISLLQDNIDLEIFDSRETRHDKIDYIMLYPTTQAILKKIWLRRSIQAKTYFLSEIDFYSEWNPNPSNSLNIEWEVSNCCMIAYNDIYEALIELIEEYDKEIKREHEIIDYTSKVDYTLSTVLHKWEKILYKTKYMIIAWSAKDPSLVNHFIKSWNFWWKHNLNHWSAIINDEYLEKISNENTQDETIIETNKKICDHKKQMFYYLNWETLTINRFWEELFLQFSSKNNQIQATNPDQMLDITNSLLSTLWYKINSLITTNYYKNFWLTLSKLQQNNVFFIWHVANQYSFSQQTINQWIADIDNLAWKIIFSETFEKTKVLQTYQEERLISHKTDHHINTSLINWIYGISRLWILSSLYIRWSIMNSAFQKKIKSLYTWSPDQYPESSLRVEEYPSLMQLAPRNKETDANRADGYSFFRWPKAWYQAPAGHLVFKSNELKQNRKDLLQNNKFILLFFDWLDSDNEETIYEQMNLVETIHGDLLSVFRITTSYDISSHDSDTRVLWDPDWTLHNLYNAKKSCMYLIRPDWVIAYRSLGLYPDRLQNYLNNLIWTNTY